MLLLHGSKFDRTRSYHIAKQKDIRLHCENHTIESRGEEERQWLQEVYRFVVSENISEP